jgi:hypothetical protein
MLTYAKLLELSKEDDQLIDPDNHEAYEFTDDGLILFGNTVDGYMSDLKIRINIDGTLTAWVRDPKDCKQEESFHGPVWCEERKFENIEILRGWAYSW